MLAALLISGAATLPAFDTEALLARYAAMRSDASGAALVEVVVRPDGKAATCRAIMMAGARPIAGRICPTLRALRWRPATVAGTPAYGRVRQIYKMFAPDTREGREIAALQQAPDLEIFVAPRGPVAGPYPPLRLILTVDASGQATECAAPAAEAANPELAALACAQARGMRFDPLLLAGEATPFVTNLIVKFTSGGER